MFTKDHTRALKGFAIAAMLFHHCFFTPKIYSGFSVNFFPLSEAIVNNLATFGKLCVGTFAFCSGYGLSTKWQKKESSFSNYLTTRYFSTMSGYWFVFIMCCVVCQLLDGQTVKVYFSGERALNNIAGFFASFFGMSRLLGTPMLIYEWWYMSAAIAFILMVPVFHESVNRIGMGATTLFLVLIPRLFCIEFLGGTQPLSFMMPVLLGVYFEHAHVFDVLHQKSAQYFRGIIGNILLSALSLAVLLFAYKLYRSLSFDAYWEIKYGIVPLLVIVCINELVTRSEILIKVLGFLGKHSMNMYLIHMVFLTYMKEFLFSGRYFLVTWFILMTLSLTASILIEQAKRLIKWENLIDLIRRKGLNYIETCNSK